MRTPERRPAACFRHSALIAAFACALGTQSALGATYTVNVGGDPPELGSGQLSLRYAIRTANSECAGAPHTITFSGALPFVIAPSSALPAITCGAVTIQGPGGGQVAIDGSGLFSPACGLTASSVSTRIEGLEVRSFIYGGASYGLCGTLEAVNNNVHGNVKGFYLDGGAIVTNNQIHNNTIYGVYDAVGGSTISGNTIELNSADGIYSGNNMVVVNNTISNNSSTGVYVGSAGTITGNTIFGNFNGIEAGAASVIRGNTVHGHPVEGTGIYLYSGGTIGGTGTGEGNVLYDNDTGIRASTGPVTISNNLIGTPDGSTPGSGGYGIVIDNVSGYSISGNVISGQAAAGLTIYSATGAGTVTGNMIGVNASGTAALPNNRGIAIYGGAPTVSNNVISGNGTGVLVQADGVILNANKIGTNAAGTAGIANTSEGVYAQCAGAMTITGNQVSSNGSNGGLVLFGVSGSTINGNLIGTAADGSSALANNGNGISVNSSGLVCSPALRGPDPEPKAAKVLANNLFDGNTIAHNNGDGILVSAGTGNVIRGGSIHSNALKNINLNYSGGPLPNDALDGDAGANGLQNHPVITSAVEDSGSTVIGLTLSSLASSTFDVDIYANGAPATPAGQTFLGRVTVTTDAAGVASATATFPGGHTHITASATGADGTSEFSSTLPSLVPGASILPTSVPFGNVVVGATLSTATEVAFRSNGTGDYMIDSISQGTSAPACPGTSSPVCATGDFSCSVSCTTGTLYPPLAPTAPPSCKISGLSFHPSAAGAQSTTLWVCDNTSASARAITITGTGVPHVISASQSAHNFGNVSIGTQVASPSILVTNASTNPPALLGPPTVAAPFSVGSNTCGSSLAPGASCNFTVVYAPTAVGPSTGTFSMTVANGNPVVVTLQGSGVSTAVGQLPLPAGIDFGTAVLAAAPLQHTLTLQNTGNGPVTFSAISATAPFQMSHNCPASLAPSASCLVNLAFEPLIYGNSTGQLVVSSDAGSGNQVVTLLATVDGVGYALSPWDLSFGAVPVGSTSPSRTIAVSNNGDNGIPLSGIAVSGPYTLVSNGCGAGLAPHSFCTAEVAFAPVVPGPAEGSFTAQVGLEGAPPAVARLSGTGTQQPNLVLPGAIDFGTLLRADVPSVRTLELLNSGNATLTFSASISGPFALSGDCGASLAPSASCTLMIAFTPSAIGEFSGSLDVVSNAPGGSRAIPVAARVHAQPRADLRVDVSAMGFGDRMIGTSSAPQRVTVSNVGLMTAQLGVLLPTRDFAATSQCGATLAPGASCSVNVVFLPLATGLRFNQLQFTSDAPGSPFGVDLTGRGCSPLRPGRPPSCN